MILLLVNRLGPGEIEIGLGIHGEPGTTKVPSMPADELVERMLAQITASKHFGGPIEQVGWQCGCLEKAGLPSTT